MKRLMLLALACCLLLSAAAVAESTDEGGLLQQVINAALEKAQAEGTDASDGADAADASGAAAGVNVGPEVRIDDAFYQKVRSSAYLYEGSYSNEVNVLVELTNVSGKNLYPDDVTITIYNAAGEVLDADEYAYSAPSMVENGGSLFIWTYFYAPDFALADIGYFTATIESDTDSYTQYGVIEATASLEDGIVSTHIVNTLDTPIYGLEMVTVITDDAGAILDVATSYTGKAIGIEPGSTMILRDNAQDFANDAYLTQGNCTAYGLYAIE